VVGRLDERLKELNAALKALKDQEKAVRTEVVPVLKEGKGAEAALEAAVKAAEAAVRGLLLAWA
jgi:predicted  nucleic acid-binding Zn-ribbon protein